MNTDFTWLIGGPQGSGVESAANIFSKVCAQMGYQIFGKREFYSNIKYKLMGPLCIDMDYKNNNQK